MSAADIREHIESLCSHLLFDFEGKSCGVDPLASDHFDMWCEWDMITVKSVDEVMNSNLFNGHTLLEIADKIENIEM